MCLKNVAQSHSASQGEIVRTLYVQPGAPWRSDSQARGDCREICDRSVAGFAGRSQEPESFASGGAIKAAFLGTTRNRSTPPPPTPSTSFDSSTVDARFRRLEKFELQAIAAKILRPFLTVDKDNNMQLPRICKCLNVRRSKYVEVWQSSKTNLAYYGGLVICGSVWNCLPCASKISGGRAEEVRQAVDIWESRGGSVVMLTQTFPHYDGQECAALYDRYGKARKLQKNRKPYKRLMASLGLVGDINRTEVTTGLNGWHIHSHTLLFFEGPVLLQPWEIFKTWESACISAGLPAPSFEHGVKISTPQEMADYITKQGKETSNWTIEAEMTKGHIKRGGREGLTPFDLLRAYRDTNNDRYSKLFVEYSQAFKGKRQLVWSPGLRDLLGMTKEKTDQELAESVDQLDQLFGMIPDKVWEYVRKHPEKNYRGKLLEAVNISEEMFVKALQVLQLAAGYVDSPF